MAGGKSVSQMAIVPPLNQGWGYGIVLGIGALFALGMVRSSSRKGQVQYLITLQVITTWALKRYKRELQTSEMFSTAGRTVKSGLVASAVVSSWTWAATLLQSSSVAYNYGVSGPFWYASGATVQILLFATIAIELKRRAPNAHVSPYQPMTSLYRQLIRYRHSLKQYVRDMGPPLILCLPFLASSQIFLSPPCFLQAVLQS
jgi:hypothetical protein